MGEPRVYKVGDPAIPPGAVYVGRGCRQHRKSRWGNPFRITRETPAERARVIEQFRVHALLHLARDPDWLRPLRGRSLVCHCAPPGGAGAGDPLVCHGQVLLVLANRLESREDA